MESYVVKGADHPIDGSQEAGLLYALCDSLERQPEELLTDSHHNSTAAGRTHHVLGLRECVGNAGLDEVVDAVFREIA